LIYAYYLFRYAIAAMLTPPIFDDVAAYGEILHTLPLLLHYAFRRLFYATPLCRYGIFRHASF